MIVGLVREKGCWQLEMLVVGNACWRLNFILKMVYTGCFISSVETLELDKKNCGGVVPFLEAFYSVKTL